MHAYALNVPWRRYCEGELNIGIVHNPKIAFSIDPELFDKIVLDADSVAESSFGKCLVGSDSTREHLLGVDRVSFVSDESGEILGFASSKIYPDDDLLYLHGVVIDNRLKGRGVGKALVRELIDNVSTSKIAFTTQNPAMYCMIRSFCGDEVYPSPQQPVVPATLHTLGVTLMKHRSGSFDANTFVSKGLYVDCLYDRIPTVSDGKVQEWFWRTLHEETGTSNDGFLFVGRINGR